ncbi:olfactory receptor 1468-like [Gastrophryne carolinensis]
MEKELFYPFMDLKQKSRYFTDKVKQSHSCHISLRFCKLPFNEAVSSSILPISVTLDSHNAVVWGSDDFQQADIHILAAFRSGASKDLPRLQIEVKWQSNITTIRLLGFGNMGNLSSPFFTMILVIYCVTICGNLLIITLVSYSKTLRTPMYFFLTQLSIADIILATNITPNVLNLIINEMASMSFPGCITQFYFFCFPETIECFLLMVMSYDRYLAICSPLHYVSIMSQSLCYKLVLACWLVSSCETFVLTFSICQLEFCGPNTIDHFFSDFIPLLELSCSDTFLVQIEDTLLGIPVAVIPFLSIVISYIYIVSAIVKISSYAGRVKAFSTCSSHLIVVCIFYGTLIVMYMLPNEGKSLIMNKTLSMMYTVMTPFLNPLIYSLRNKDIKSALKSVFRQKHSL